MQILKDWRNESEILISLQVLKERMVITTPKIALFSFWRFGGRGWTEIDRIEQSFKEIILKVSSKKENLCSWFIFSFLLEKKLQNKDIKYVTQSKKAFFQNIRPGILAWNEVSLSKLFFFLKKKKAENTLNVYNECSCKYHIFPWTFQY